MSIKQVYGHEQRHIKSAQEIMKREAEARVKKYEKKYDTMEACETAKKSAEDEFKDIIKGIRDAQGSHSSYGGYTDIQVPGNAVGYPPTGKMPNIPKPKPGTIIDINVEGRVRF